MRKIWITISVLTLMIFISVVSNTIPSPTDGGQSLETMDSPLECRDPDTNLKIQESDIAKDAKSLIINQGTQARKLYTENGRDLISPKVADHILVEVMGVRKRPIYEKYPACASQLAKSLKHELG